MKRLNYFPTPYPDECLYSIFARYYLRSGITSSKTVTKQFFGCDCYVLASTVFLPRKLERMDYWIDSSCGLTAEELICRHTTYPYQSISYTKELYLEMERIIQEGSPASGIASIERRMIAKSGYFASGKYLRYCPECTNEDIQNYGETYWHRLPQLPGIRYCPKHGCRIRDSAASFDELRVRIYPASYVLRYSYKEETLKDDKAHLREQLLTVAKNTEWLLEHGREFGGYPEISRKYRDIMKEQGYANFYGISNREAIRLDFQKVFSEEIMSELFAYHVTDQYFWLRYLQESIGFNLKPLHHVLLMEFFAGSAEQFMRQNVRQIIPYDSDTEPCINKICSRYLRNAAKRTQIRKMGEETWAWFECPHCGMRYRRSNPKQTLEEYLEHPCISDRGFLYQEQLEKYLTDTRLSKRAIASRLGVSPSTVAKYVIDNGIDMRNRYKSSYYTSEKDNTESRDVYFRRRVLEELNKTPVMSCKDLKERVPGAYEWFMRKDPEWIQSKLIHEFDKPRWDEWGEAALLELRAAYAEIKASGDSRKRINISWLARVAGINRDTVYGRLPYLPEMQQFFDEVCETQEAWIRRRYTEVALEKKAAGGTKFTYDDVKRKVQIRRGSYDRNKPLIEELIRELNKTLFDNEE